MRERSVERRAQRASSRGCARTMPRWLMAAVLLAAAGAGVAAWTPPGEPLLLVPRSRRSAHSTRHIQLLGWQLELRENEAIRSPHYDECQFYKGRVTGEENSIATVTECAGQLYGLLQVGSESFVLEPTHDDGTHVLRKRDVFLSEHPAAYNLTGDTVTELDLDLEEDAEIAPVSHVHPRHSDAEIAPVSHVHPRHSDAEIAPVSHVHPRHSDAMEKDYFRAEPVTRPVPGQGLWLELAIVADHTMMKFHGDRVKHYILALMNIVSAIFNDPSLESNMTLVINKLFLYGEDSIVKYGNVKRSLEAVNKWNYRHLIKLPPGSAKWDATVWLTRAPLGGPSGFAPVGGVCSMMRSAAIDRDEGLTSAFVIAHELAHLLGLTHDDESCQTDRSHGSVMAPIVLATLHNYAWSSCSKKQFHQKTKNWACLHERSQADGVELGGAKEISNYMFTMDEQCRSGFGEGFSVCKTVKVRSDCSRLWCAHRAVPLVCRAKRAPPLEGTPCGENMWCVDRVCEPMPGHGGSTKPAKEHLPDEYEDEIPRWTEWGDWSECTSDCGYGLRVRTRKCRHKGTVSPGMCEGAGSQMAACWAGRACAASRDPRAELCHRRARDLIPHVPADDSKQCDMWCKDYTGGEATNFGALPDGTSCSYEQPFDVCFQGTCVKGQCNSTDPVCNWCPDGYCNNNTYVYSRRLGKEWTRLTLVPHEAHQLSIHVTTPVPLHIALRERKREKPVLELSKHSKRIEIHNQQDNYLKYDPNVPQNLQIVEVDNHVIDIKEGGQYSWEGEVVAAGTLLRWKQNDTDVFISSSARLQIDLMIMAIPEHELMEEASVQVAVNYSTPAAIEHRRPLQYRWSVGRGPCSVSCGGGVRAVRPRCSRDMTKCPPTRYEACNTHSCEFVWAAGDWEQCSATCGGAGLQERQLFCVPANVTTNTRRALIKASVSPALCPSSVPEKQQPCNRQPCRVYWREMPWTPCSTTCGRGISRRPLTCPASDERLCGPRPTERRRRCHLRRCRRPSRLTHACPSADTSHYCELFDADDLKRNCKKLPPFRKACCNTCRNVFRYTRVYG